MRKEPLPCAKCGRLYRQDLLSKCPGCASTEVVKNPNYQDPSITSGPDATVARTYSSSHEPTLADVIAATNRTTHAIRAFVLFLFYQLTALTIAAFFYFIAVQLGNANEDCGFEYRALGACAPNAFFVFIAVIVWIAGLVFSSQVGWREIELSRVKK